jgi:hypothetical protein
MPGCPNTFTPRRVTRKYCSPRCKTAASRAGLANAAPEMRQATPKLRSVVTPMPLPDPPATEETLKTRAKIVQLLVAGVGYPQIAAAVHMSEAEAAKEAGKHLQEMEKVAGPVTASWGALEAQSLELLTRSMHSVLQNNLGELGDPHVAIAACDRLLQIGRRRAQLAAGHHAEPGPPQAGPDAIAAIMAMAYPERDQDA